MRKYSKGVFGAKCLTACIELEGKMRSVHTRPIGGMVVSFLMPAKLGGVGGD